MLWRSTNFMKLAIRNLLLLCTAFLVLGWQVFGMSRGFLCDCGGRVEITAADHCHGPHGDACHESTEAACQESDHHGEPGETRQHPPLKEDLISHSVPQKITLPAVIWHCPTTTISMHPNFS